MISAEGRGVVYADFGSWTIKMSPRSAFEEILLHHATAHILSAAVLTRPAVSVQCHKY